MPSPLADRLRTITLPQQAPPVVSTSARALARQFGLPTPAASASPGSGLAIDVAGGAWALDDGLAPSADAWMWIQLGADGQGRLTASSPALLYGLVTLLTDELLALDAASLSRGVLIEPSFRFNRPLYDQVLTQVARSTRGFDPEPYIEQLARSGFTHLEVNGLAFHIPFEPGVPSEYYNQFYTYCAGFNHFVESELTRGLYPAEYLQANLNRVRNLAELGRRYGLKPGFLSFEPRSLPEWFFQRHPTLRGARIDHPFRSHLPRYTLAQDHPVAQEHYRALVRNLMEAVPDLDYLSVWTNDSGAGFEHTSSLYVGRNGGPYMIREWREHEQIAEVAGTSVVGWLRMIREAAAEVNPDFQVMLRLEPFKVEHDVIVDGLGDGLSVDVPSLLVRGYELPYHHPRYAEQTSAAGSIYHTSMDERETELLRTYREAGFEPKLHYAPGASFNMEPLLGIPFPRMLHRKLTALREAGFRDVNAIGGLLHLEKTPYWPHPEVIRAVQFTPQASIDEVLRRTAARWTRPEDAEALVAHWDALEEAVSYMPIVPLYSNLGFVWYRTWVRPLVPDIGAIPDDERRYYEQFMVTTDNNPNNVDLGRDVLFELITEASGRRMTSHFDAEALPRIRAACGALDRALASASPATRPVLQDLRDRATALLCWATTQRNTCAWVAGVYGYRSATTDAERERHREDLQAMIDLDLENTDRLLSLWETTETEFMLVSDVGETSFIFGENLAEQLRRKIELTEAYRHHAPRIDENILWRMPR